MNEKNKAIVAEIKTLVDRLSDLHAISVLKNYMYNSRHRIGNRAAAEAKQRAEAEVNQ